jgi:ATP-binding cassette subfamily B multidrug efflux pump
MLLTSNILLIVNPLVFRQAVLVLSEHAERDRANIFSSLFGSYERSIWPWTALLILIASISSLFKYWMRLGFVSISRDVEKDTRSILFQRIQQQSMAFYHKYGTGELLSRLTNDISAYRDILGPGIMYPLFVLTIIIPGLIALFLISKSMTLVAIIPLLIIPFANEIARKKIFSLSSLVQMTLGKISSMVQEHFSAIRIIKNFVIENEIFYLFCQISKAFSRMSLRLAFWEGSVFPFFTFLAKTTTLILVMFAGVLILKEWDVLSAADFISFMWIQSYIFYPILMLGWLVPIYEKGRAAYQRLVEIYDEPIEVKDILGAIRKIPTGANIEFKGLTFSYPHTNAVVLFNINLTIKGEQFVGITGPVGAGKTTLFRLLNREYEIPHNMILIDGHDIHEYPLSSFYQQVVTVEQLPFLFSKSIAENVKFGRRNASQEDIETVSRYADFHETVLEFPEQYETMVGERGVTLSGGQKQRLAMARAFLVNRSILLLDDVFSAVDFATEQRIFNAMRESFSSKTVLLITHRVSVLEKMDRIIYMKEGVVVEEGSPNELTRKGGSYAALVELQHMQH